MAPDSGLAGTPRSQAIGALVGALAVALTTLAIYPLREVAPVMSTGVAYLVGVLVVSTRWGLALGVLTALASAAAFNVFHIPPTGRLEVQTSSDAVGLGVFLVAATLAAGVGNLARTRAADAARRREEADLAAATARVLLGGDTLAAALDEASQLIRAALGLPDAAIVLAEVDDRPGVALDVGPHRAATLVLGADAGEETLARVREHVAPALQELLRAALDRDRMQAEVIETQALRRSDVIKTTLLRAVSHDLRSPLTAILTAGEALRSPSLAAAERAELGLVVVEEAQRLSSLVDKLLDLSKLQSGSAEPRRDWCSLEEVVQSAAAEVAGSDDAAFALTFDPGLPLVRADAAQLERVFVNVLENARRFSGGHPVNVRARVVGGKLVVRVIDRGPGMTAGELTRIFEPFYRDESQPHRGSGLGLAIVRGFVEANGGRVRAESLPRQGTVIAIELPLALAELPASAAKVAKP